VASGHAVRGTTRRAEALSSIEATGAEAAIADPDRLATVLPQIEGVSVVCWLIGSARLETLLERLVDTPVRGFVYEDGDGTALVRDASDRWRIPVELIDDNPRGHEEWVAAMTRAVDRLLAG
jgi:hypothetical protein